MHSFGLKLDIILLLIQKKITFFYLEDKKILLTKKGYNLFLFLVGVQWRAYLVGTVAYPSVYQSSSPSISSEAKLTEGFTSFYSLWLTIEGY